VQINNKLDKCPASRDIAAGWWIFIQRRPTR